jgi:hypothetical protein
MAGPKKVHWSCGTFFIRSRSMSSGLVCFVRPMRGPTRATWVSTMMPEAMLNAVLSTTLADLRAMPGRVVSSLIVFGTSPPKRSTMAWQAPRIDFAFCL